MGDATGRRMSAPHPHTTNTQSAWRRICVDADDSPDDETELPAPDSEPTVLRLSASMLGGSIPPRPNAPKLADPAASAVSIHDFAAAAATESSSPTAAARRDGQGFGRALHAGRHRPAHPWRIPCCGERGVRPVQIGHCWHGKNHGKIT